MDMRWGSQANLLKRRRRAARRLKQMKEERRHRQAFGRRQAMEPFMLYCLTAERIWMKERSSHWWEHAVKYITAYHSAHLHVLG